jgi:protein-tyrosine-phosphatase/DNA-binding transcriptional ArsR family regulator
MVNPTHIEVPLFIRLADHPLRWLLLTELASSDQRVRELVEAAGQPQNLVSYHLRVLRDGGLVTARRSSYDGRDTYYHLDLSRCAEGLTSAGAALHPGLRMGTPSQSRRSMRATPSVLFVCTGNSARSPIAEALLRHHLGGRVVVASAGISPRTRIHPEAVRVLREQFDIDIHDHTPRTIDEVTGHAGSRTVATFARIVTLCDKAREHLPQGCVGRRIHWSLADPADMPARAQHASFGSTTADIDTRVRHLILALGNER